MTLVGTVRWTFLVLAVAATVATLLLLLWSLRGRARTPELSRSDRRRPSGLRRDPREALALVGDALAATHNPRVLLPVILEVITEATDALGGQIFSGAEEVAWLGEVGGTRKPLTLELDATTRLLLFPPDDGFSKETRTLAEWLASQAAVALDNARLHDIVQRQAITDDLTGLVNRRRFIEALDAEVERARSFGSPLTIVLADLDNFKQVNDEFGHHGGDVVLRAFADLIRSHVRDVDVSGRIGGEEFAILLPETDNAGASRVAERMRRSLNEVSIPLSEGASIHVASSFGVAALSPGQTGDDLLRAADAALYRAKDEGKNRVVA
ncbi:MAG TPA: GGDEF domain-containing protein [Gaiellaceae bacterium]|jgi:diguanylate cyclase (GGDEF)-like protein